VFSIGHRLLLRSARRGEATQLPPRLVQGFFPDWYLRRYPEVEATGADPLTHYLSVGWRDGYRPNAVFDPSWYLAKYPDVALVGIEPFTHYVTVGWRENRDPCALFDTQHYRRRHLPMRRRGRDPLAHYLTDGWQDGASPHLAFDPSWYRKQHSDLIPADACPLAHFIEFGEAMGLEPSAAFDSQGYRKALPMGMLGGLTPIEHFVAHAPLVPAATRSRRNATRPTARFQQEIGGIDPTRDNTRLAIVACHDGRRRIGASSKHLAQSLRTAGFTVILVFDTQLGDLPTSHNAEDAGFDLALASEHAGYDFYSWRIALESLRDMQARVDSEGLASFEEIIMINDSVIGPLFGFDTLLRTWRASPFEVTGLVESNQGMPHLQSWAVRFSGAAASVKALLAFYGAAPPSLSRSRAVQDFELRLASKFRNEGFSVGSIVSPISIANPEANPSVNGWRELLEAGVPFVKRNVFTLRERGHGDTQHNLATLTNSFAIDATLDLPSLVRDSLEQIGIATTRAATPTG
jgi:hypothetical protein